MFHTTYPIKELTSAEFKELADKTIKISPHALDHLSDMQRRSFEASQLINPLKRETPRRIYLQMNGNYCLYTKKA